MSALTVVIVGAGLLGRGIAGVVARKGMNVILHDASPSVLEAAEQHVNELALDSGASVRAVSTLHEAVEKADIVIEAVIEKLELKQQIFQQIDAINPTALLMSNSSVIPISDIAQAMSKPERAVGTHWWNPPQLIPIVEVIRGEHTSERVMTRTTEFLAILGKQPVRVDRDVPGFVGNRLQHALWREALALVSARSGTPMQVDRVARQTLGRSLELRGPVAQMNYIGPQEVVRAFEQALPLINSDSFPAGMLRSKVQRGQLGAKTGAGFLDWNPGDRESAAARLLQHVQSRLSESWQPKDTLEPEASDADDETIARCLCVALWRESIALLEDSVCDAATVDLVAKNTFGLRLAAMGPVENADYVGLDLTLAIHQSVLPSLNARTRVPSRLLEAAQAGLQLA